MPRYRHYHIYYTTNDKGQRRWIIDDTFCESDERGRDGFETQEEVMDHVDKLMKESGREHEATSRMASEREKARWYEANRSASKPEYLKSWRKS